MRQGHAESTQTTGWDVRGEQADALDADSDGDGIPDSYEVDQGLKPLLLDGDEDLDLDGLSNLREFWAGTLANDSNSVFQISGVTRPAPGGLPVELSFSSVTGRTYRLLSSSTVDGPPVDIGSVVATNTETRMTITLQALQAFVRAEVQ